MLNANRKVMSSLDLNICLSDIPERYIRTGRTGKQYVNLTVAHRRDVGRDGETHNVSITKTRAMFGHSTIYVGSGQKSAFFAKNPLDKILDRFTTDTITLDDLKSETRRKDVVLLRHSAMYTLRNITDMSCAEIGAIFNRNYCCVCYADAAVRGYVGQPFFEDYRRRINDVLESMNFKTI